MLTLPRLLATSLALPLVMATATYTTEGCYSLSSLSSYLTSQGDYTYQTNSYCEKLCSAGGYSVAATLDGSTCYCGSQLPSDISSTDSDNCDVTCNGYGTEICGGDGYLTVSTDGDEDTSPVGSSSSSSSTSSSSSSSSSTTSASSTQSSKTSSSSSSSASSTSSSTSTKSSSSSTSSTSTSSSSSSSSSSTKASSTTTSASQVAATSIIITSIVTASNSVVTTQITTATTETSAATSSSSSTTSKSSSGLSKGAIAGIAVGSILGVLILFAIFIFLFIRSRRNEDDDDDERYTDKHDTPPPVHNDMSPTHGSNRHVYGYGAGFGSEDAFQSVPPVPFYATENGRKRLSNGSLPDARHEKTLRVTNPDETMNDTTLHDVDQSFSDDDNSFAEKLRS